ncbi:MAG: DeoR/GlpR family DNA-binding transcription regulator [Chloroflexota bacterium]
MTRTKRADEVLSFIKIQYSATVKEICDHFGLNEATVRRDLRQLQLQNLIKREYGKASIVERKGPSDAFETSSANATSTELEIVEHSLKIIHTGQVIILPGSHLTLLLARSLEKKSHISVVTNSLTIFDALKSNQNLHLISTGGIYDPLGNNLNGTIVENMLQNLRADLLFIEPSGISMREGFTHENLAQIPSLNAMIRTARQVIMLASSPTFNKQAGGIVAPLNVVHKIVTDRVFSDQELSILADMNIETISIPS